MNFVLAEGWISAILVRVPWKTAISLEFSWALPYQGDAS